VLFRSDERQGGGRDEAVLRRKETGMASHYGRLQHANPRVLQGIMRAMLGLETYLRESGLEESLRILIALRASQINGCAFCIDMHYKDARASGESEERLYMLNAWQESPLYSERERAALLWTEAVTRVADSYVPDGVYEEVHRAFSDDELANLTLAVVAINGWNRLNISFRTVPGGYQPAVAVGASA